MGVRKEMKNMIKFHKTKRFIVVFLSLLIFISILQIAASTNPSSDIDIEVTSDEEIKVALFEEGLLLYSIEYERFILDTDEGRYDFYLNQVDWNIQVIERMDESFPHTEIVMESELREEEHFIGNLNFNIKVLTQGDVSEVTFSFTLSDMNELSGGSIEIVKEISTNGFMVREPEEDKENYKFEYESGHVGYYGWKNELAFDGKTTELTSIPTKGDIGIDNGDIGGLVILGNFDEKVDKISIEPLEIERTNIGAAVPVPEPYDHLPSFAIGLMIGTGVVIGVLAEKRRKFYQNRDPEKTVNLEESYYYRGKE